MRISDWSSDVCSSDLRVDTLVDALARDPAVDDEPVPADVARDRAERDIARRRADLDRRRAAVGGDRGGAFLRIVDAVAVLVVFVLVIVRGRLGEDQSAADIARDAHRSEEHTSELQSLMRISYAVFCLKKKKTKH